MRHSWRISQRRIHATGRPRVALDEGDVGQIVTTDLIDPVRQDFVKAVVHVEDGLPLQGRMDAVEVLALKQKLKDARVSRARAVVPLDLLVVRCGNKSVPLLP